MKTVRFQFLLGWLVFLGCNQHTPQQTNQDTLSKKGSTIITKKDNKRVSKKDSLPLIPDSLEWKNIQVGMIYRAYKYYDINGDGFKDSLIREFATGNGGFSSSGYMVKSGKDQKTIEINHNYSPAYVKELIAYPSYYTMGKNKPFFEVIKAEYINIPRNPDSSLQWILQCTLSKQVLVSHPFFQEVYRFNPRFVPGKLQLPRNYCIEVNNDTLLKMAYSKIQSEGRKFENRQIQYFLTYKGRNIWELNEDLMMKRNRDANAFKKLKRADSSATYTIYTLPHGVVAKKNKAYAWIFVSDFDLTGSPEKMRWNSIKSAKLSGKYVIINHSLGVVAFNGLQRFIVNIESGLCVKLKQNLQVADSVLLEAMERL